MYSCTQSFNHSINVLPVEPCVREYTRFNDMHRHPPRQEVPPQHLTEPLHRKPTKGDNETQERDRVGDQGGDRGTKDGTIEGREGGASRLGDGRVGDIGCEVRRGEEGGGAS